MLKGRARVTERGRERERERGEAPTLTALLHPSVAPKDPRPIPHPPLSACREACTECVFPFVLTCACGCSEGLAMYRSAGLAHILPTVPSGQEKAPKMPRKRRQKVSQEIPRCIQQDVDPQRGHGGGCAEAESEREREREREWETGGTPTLPALLHPSVGPKGPWPISRPALSSDEEHSPSAGKDNGPSMVRPCCGPPQESLTRTPAGESHSQRLDTVSFSNASRIPNCSFQEIALRGPRTKPMSVYQCPERAQDCPILDFWGP